MLISTAIRAIVLTPVIGPCLAAAYTRRTWPTPMVTGYSRCWIFLSGHTATARRFPRAFFVDDFCPLSDLASSPERRSRFTDNSSFESCPPRVNLPFASLDVARRTWGLSNMTCPMMRHTNVGENLTINASCYRFLALVFHLICGDVQSRYRACSTEYGSSGGHGHELFAHARPLPRR